MRELLVLVNDFWARFSVMPTTLERDSLGYAVTFCCSARTIIGLADFNHQRTGLSERG
jgi:hypothetical protein